MREILDFVILIVNGGDDPEGQHWIKLCIEKINQHTSSKYKFKMLVYNNNYDDEHISSFLKSQSNVFLIQSFPNDYQTHFHTVPLQRLYHKAIDLYEFNKFIVMDSDAHPISENWIDELIKGVELSNSISGIFRDELKAIKPYVHPSCMMIKTSFMEKYNIRLDENVFISKASSLEDSCSNITRIAIKHHYTPYRLCRSNKYNYHFLMGGIYADLIYHHGAGSRNNITFWGDDNNPVNNDILNDQIQRFLFNNYDRYICSLKGDDEPLDLSEVVPKRKSDNRFLSRVRRKMGSLIMRKDDLPIKTIIDESVKEEHLIPIPEGWSSSAPTFVGVGVPKAGTTWFHKLLFQHPDIVNNRLPLTKELNFFNFLEDTVINETNKKLYNSIFLSLTRSDISGEFTTRYLHHYSILPNLKNTSPEAKIILILRNPIDRYHSHLNHLLINRSRRYKLPLKDSFFINMDAKVESIFYSMYFYQVSKMLELFDRNQVLVILYEDLKDDAHKMMKNVFEFLGIRPDYKLVQSEKKENFQEYIIDELTDEDRKLLKFQFAEDVNNLKSLLPDIDFSKWIDFEASDS